MQRGGGWSAWLREEWAELVWRVAQPTPWTAAQRVVYKVPPPSAGPEPRQRRGADQWHYLQPLAPPYRGR